jgi:DNA-binding response OmpR family regulator
MSGSLVSAVYPFSARSRKSLFLVRPIPQMTLDDRHPMKRILVIEDELEMLRNLTTILRLEKFHPLSAENGHLGIDLAKKQKPDLILCDVMMPGLDGYGVIAALRGNTETVTIPFIFLTALAEKLDIPAGMNLGADQYITKPVAKADLLAAIHSRLAIHSSRYVVVQKPNPKNL